MTDACETAETVAEVLDRHMDSDHVRRMQAVLTGDRDASTLDCEDWVLPMKLTGGRVCLRFDVDHLDEQMWLKRGCDGHLYRLHDVDLLPLITDPDDVWEHGLNDPHVDVTPVLREDTPFSGCDDDE